MRGNITYADSLAKSFFRFFGVAPRGRGSYLFGTEMREPPAIQQVDRTYVRLGRRRLSYFAGCDYFRLASHSAVLRAVADGMNNFGLNVAASRMTTGNHPLFGELEQTLSRFFGVESATLVANGYVTNLIAAQALAGEFSHVLIDEKAHPSLKDAAPMLGVPVRAFKHRDAADLKRAATRKSKGVRFLVLTDGMFSGTGETAPLAAYLKVLPQTAWLLVDDAHGAGTMGGTGRGTVEVEQVPCSRVIQCITLSKAFGVYGGSVLGPAEVRNKILCKSRMFVGSTPLPLPLVHGAITSVRLLQSDKTLRQRLEGNISYVRSALEAAGLNFTSGAGPIISVVPKNAAHAKVLHKRCLARRVFPSFIHYPGGPESGYFRFVLSSEHTRSQLDDLIDVIAGK